MSRLDELKKQYPELTISILDILKMLDKSKTYKYLPLLCKIFGKRFNLELSHGSQDLEKVREDYKQILSDKGFDTSKFSDNELIVMRHFNDLLPHDYIETFNSFMRDMELGIIEKKDVTAYSTIDEIRQSVSLASLKTLNKELEGQVLKEFEDDTWVILRPLTFQSSARYGSSTRWCTTYQAEKQYFERYWRRGILVYFINKNTGYKFAGFKALDEENELSFWNAEDQRVDFLNVDVDDYLFPIVKKIFSSKQTNRDLSSEEIRDIVNTECSYELKSIIAIPEQEPLAADEYEIPQTELNRMSLEISDGIDRMAFDRLRDAVQEYQNLTEEYVNEQQAPIVQMSARITRH